MSLSFSPEKVRVGRPPATEYHKDVLDLFTTPHRSKLPNSLNKHFVLPSVNAETKPERPSMIPICKYGCIDVRTVNESRTIINVGRLG